MSPPTMASERYRRLISGSDLRGVALEGYGKEVTLTPNDAAAATRAFAAMLKAEAGEDGVRVAVGHDPRLSWKGLYEGVLRGLATEGCAAVDCGLATTPAMFAAVTGPPHADGAIMLTASHLPPERNGLKFFTPRGGLTSSQLRALVEDMRPVEQGGAPDVQAFDLIGAYGASLRTFIAGDDPGALRGMRIALDAGNGSGGFFAEVLISLGAQVFGQYVEPDGRFPNHAPNPEEPGAIAALCEHTARSGADMGVMFDADCDRAALVDPSGKPVNRDRLIALVAALVLKEHPGAAIVTDSVASEGLSEFIRARGGIHRRYKRGYRNVIDEALRLNAEGINCPAALETSGHCALAENRFLDDGMYLVAWLLKRFAREKGQSFTALMEGLREPAEDVEIRLTLANRDFAADAARTLSAVRDAVREDPALTADTDCAEGVRARLGEDGWFLIRQSVHDPVLPVNLQAERAGGAKAMAARLLEILGPLGGEVELAPLRQML